MSSNIAISVKDIRKSYQIYHQPKDRLKQAIFPKLGRLFGQSERNYFSEFWALKGVSFEIRKGETVGIVGRNGSGKSTLLQIICGTLSPTEGELRASGRIAALLELGSGFNPEFSGRENIYMNAALLGLSKEETDARYDDIVRFADIGDFLDQPVKTYSSGMAVRLAFSVAINADPEILIVDEALSVGDELFQRKCFARIEAIKKLGATILFVSHSGGTVIELCDRAILMDAGQSIAIGDPKTIVATYQKLLYAPAEQRSRIREKILAHHLEAEGNANANSAVQGVSGSADGEIAPARATAQLADTFDPYLVPVSTLEFESYGAFIREPRITTVDGKIVNQLRCGSRYKYCYDVDFEIHATNVRFGMMIKTTSGVELGGASSGAVPEEEIAYVGPASRYEVEFEFVCSLNPGVYFLNAGVRGATQDSETYLHRLIDAAMFRVQSTPESPATGIVDFQCMPAAKLAERV
jgi:lipopolysaccharide transport system ATP-binding protein